MPRVAQGHLGVTQGHQSQNLEKTLDFESGDGFCGMPRGRAVLLSGSNILLINLIKYLGYAQGGSRPFRGHPRSPKSKP